MRTPSDSAAAFSPHASRAGSTSAARSLRHSPPVYVGECTSARIASASSSSTFWPRPVSNSCSAASSSRYDGGCSGRGDVDHAGALVVAVDRVALDRRLDGVEVVQAELFEQFDLVGEAMLAVGDAVGERRLHEPAVATARRRTDLGGVDQHDVTGRVALLGDDRRPQPGVAAADDAQVARLGAHERRVGVRLVDVVVPVREQVGVGDGVEVIHEMLRRSCRLRAVYGSSSGASE